MPAEYKDIVSYHKSLNNETIARWVAMKLGLGTHHCLVLDGPMCRTSAELLERKLSKPHMIYAPQFNKRDAIKMKNRNMCNVFPMTLSQAVANVDDGGIPASIMAKISVFNFDYMGSVFGRRGTSPSNPEIYPLTDLMDCLEKTKKKDIIVSITVSDRLGSKISLEKKFFEGREGNFGKQLDKDFFIPVFNYNQFQMVKGQFYCYSREQGPEPVAVAPGRSRYGRPVKAGGFNTSPAKKPKSAKMWFFIYHLRKDQSLDPETVDFALSPMEGEESYIWGFNPSRPDSHAE